MSKKKQWLKQQQEQTKTIITTLEAEIVSRDGDGPIIIGQNYIVGTKNGPVQTRNAIITKSYNRQNKSDKVTSQYRLGNAKLCGNELAMLLQDYDAVYVIDTNTSNPETTGKNLSVCCFSFFFKPYKSCPHIYSSNHVTFFTLENEKQNPEKVAISRLIHYLEIHTPNMIGRKFAIITDHDLGDHGEFNTHTREFLPGYSLPEYITLMYASAERGSDIVNKEIKKCDATATAILNEWLSNGYIKESLSHLLFSKRN